MAASPRRFPSRSSERGGIIFRFIFLLCFLCFLFVLYVLRHPLLRMAGSFWIVDDPPAASDAIVLLGDDNYNADRATHAAELFKAGWAPRIVASGRYLRPYATIAELEEHDLESRGVPKNAIVRCEHRSDDTRTEAGALAATLAQHNWKRILLVTSNYHTRRAKYIAARTFPRGTVLRVEAAPDSEYDPDHWWETRRGVKIFFHEFVGIFVALWEMRHHEDQTSDSAREIPAMPRVNDLYQPATLLVYRHLRLYYSFHTA